MKTWEYYGKRDPYYGVLSAEEFRATRMDEQARQRFFASGADQVDRFLELAGEVSEIKFGTALDYGCGVGRLTLALSSRFSQVVAVDLSSDMIAEARRNLAARTNVAFELANEMGSQPIDFLMSKIVFQHIPASQGIEILGRLSRRLSAKGAGVIDFPVKYTGGFFRKHLRIIRMAWPFGEPRIPMYVYDLNQIMQTLRDNGARNIEVKRIPAPPFEKAIVVFSR